MRLARIAAVLALAVSCGAGAVHAHVALAVQSAPAGSDFRAVFTVEHGCGNAATTALRIRLDDKIVSATPVAKKGWTAQVTQAAAPPTAARPPQMPREASWTGGSVPAHSPDEFTLLVRLPDAPSGTVIYFPVVQECGTTAVRWIEVPLPGEEPGSLDQPAPFVTLTNGSSPPTAAH